MHLKVKEKESNNLMYNINHSAAYRNTQPDLIVDHQ